MTITENIKIAQQDYKCHICGKKIYKGEAHWFYLKCGKDCYVHMLCPGSN